MKQIEKLLAEYKIRFRDTDRIRKEGYFPYPRDVGLLNKGTTEESVSGMHMTNKNGSVWLDSYGWATADLTEAPDKWVVERDEKHKHWDEFASWFGNDGAMSVTGFFNYYSHTKRDDSLLAFRDHQYLTLDQWYELVYKPMTIDLNLLDSKDWVHVESNIEYCYLIKKGKINDNGFLTVKHCWSYEEEAFISNGDLVYKDSIKKMRVPTDIDLAPLYKKHPELEEPKVGDFCVFFDKDDEFDKNDISIGILDEDYLDNILYYAAMKILPDWGYNEILKRYETFKKVML